MTQNISLPCNVSQKLLEIGVLHKMRSKQGKNEMWDPGNRAVIQEGGEGNSQTVGEVVLQGGSYALELKTNPDRAEE